MKVLLFLVVVSASLMATSKPYVCYTKKIVSDSTGKLTYIGCKRYNDSCESNNKLHFGKYPSESKASSALRRCKSSSPKFVDSGHKGTTQTGIVHSLDPNGDGFLSIRNKIRGREIGKLYNGDKVKILSKKGKYYKIKKVSSGMVGYAHSNWIRKTSSTSSSNTATSSNKVGVVHGLDPNGDGFLALRAKYKTGRQIGKLYEGDKVKILAKRGKWYKVKTVSSGQIGWAHGGWVRETSSHSTQKYYNKSKNKWITPNNSICRAMGGELYKDLCKASREQAKNICRISGGSLPTLNELMAVISECGGITVNDEFIHLENKENSKYQSCYRKKGFTSSNYWSSTSFMGSNNLVWYVGFDKGNHKFDDKSNSNYIRCIRVGE